jgi:hypothetical protein
MPNGSPSKKQGIAAGIVGRRLKFYHQKIRQEQTVSVPFLGGKKGGIRFVLNCEETKRKNLVFDAVLVQIFSYNGET